MSGDGKQRWHERFCHSPKPVRIIPRVISLSEISLKTRIFWLKTRAFQCRSNTPALAGMAQTPICLYRLGCKKEAGHRGNS